MVIGPWCTIPSPQLANVLSASGMDFVILDREHGPLSMETISTMVMACEAENCTPLVRVRNNEASEILNALDSGAHGIIVPHIETAADAQKAVSFIKYPPAGQRGFSPYTKAGLYQGGKGYTSKANQETMVILIVEGQKGLEELDKIIAIPGIDVIYIGAYDLSQTLGIPGEIHSVKVKEQIEKAVSKIIAKNIVAGSFVAKTKEDIDWLKKIGVRFITTWVDANLIQQKYLEMSSYLK